MRSCVYIYCFRVYGSILLVITKLVKRKEMKTSVFLVLTLYRKVLKFKFETSSRHERWVSNDHYCSRFIRMSS